MNWFKGIVMWDTVDSIVGTLNTATERLAKLHERKSTLIGKLSLRLDKEQTESSRALRVHNKLKELLD